MPEPRDHSAEASRGAPAVAPPQTKRRRSARCPTEHWLAQGRGFQQRSILPSAGHRRHLCWSATSWRAAAPGWIRSCLTIEDCAPRRVAPPMCGGPAWNAQPSHARPPRPPRGAQAHRRSRMVPNRPVDRQSGRSSRSAAAGRQAQRLPTASDRQSRVPWFPRRVTTFATGPVPRNHWAYPREDQPWRALWTATAQRQ